VIEVKIIKHLREIYCGDEFLVADAEHYKRLRVLKEEAGRGFKEDIAKYFVKFQNIESTSIILPDSYEIKDSVKVYFPYFEGKRINLQNVNEKQLFHSILEILREFLHQNVAIPVLSLDDFLEWRGHYYMLIPCWFNSEKMPDSKCFVAPEFRKIGKCTVESTAYVFGKLFKSICSGEELINVADQLSAEEPEKRRIHINVANFAMLKTLAPRTDLRRFRKVIVDRKEKEDILNFVRNNRRGLATLNFMGPEGSGKTTLLELISDELRFESGQHVVWIKNTYQFLESLLQLTDEETLKELFQNHKDVIEKVYSKKEFNHDEALLFAAFLLNKLQSIVLIIDDFNAFDEEFNAFIQQLTSYNYQPSHTIIISSREKVEMKFEKHVIVEPWDISAVREYITRTLEGTIPEIEIDKFCRWIHAVSRGRPGYIEKILKILHERDFFKKNHVLKLEELFEMDFQEIVSPIVDTFTHEDAKYISLCGSHFNENDLRLLARVLKTSLKSIYSMVQRLMTKEIVYKESDRYVFSLKEFWQKMYHAVDSTTREHIHTEMARQIPEIAKAAWHLEMLGRNVSAATRYLLHARKMIREYSNLGAALNYIDKAQRLIGNRLSYAAVSLKFRALEIRGEARSLENFAYSLPQKDRFAFFSFASFVRAARVEEARLIMKEFPSVVEGRALYSRVLRRYLTLKLSTEEGKLVDKIEARVLEELAEQLKPIALHQKLKARVLNILGGFVGGYSRTKSMDLLLKAQEISEQWNFKDVLVETLNRIATVFGTSPGVSEMLERAVKIAQGMGAIGLSLEPLSNLAWSNLYKGNIRKMFSELHVLRRVASLAGNMRLEAYSYFVEANFHMYNKEFDEAVEDLERELKIEKYLGVEERALRGLIVVSCMKGDLSHAREIVHRNMENPAVNQVHFVELRNLILAETDEEFRKAWTCFRHKETPYWNEESCQIFSKRLAKIDPEGFQIFAENLEIEAIQSSALLSLAQVYEGLAFFHKERKNPILTYKYAEKAVSLYKTTHFDGAADVLSKFFGVGGGIDEALSEIQTLKEKLPEELKKIVSLNEKKIRLSFRSMNQAAYNLDTLRVINPQQNLETVLEFLLTRLVNTIPATKAALSLIDGEGNQLFCAKFGTREIPRDYSMSLEPLRINYETKVYEEYKARIFVANPGLYLNSISSMEIMSALISFEETMIYSLKNVIIYHQSVMDPLTGLFTRWYFMTRLREEFDRVKRYGGNFSVIMGDIDDFKSVNDTYGHQMGDEVLKFIAGVLKSSTRSTDIVGRYGGEEFIIILPGTGLNGGFSAATKILQQIANLNPFEFPVTMSMGVSSFPENEVAEANELIALADKSLYESKRRGKNRVTVTR